MNNDKEVKYPTIERLRQFVINRAPGAYADGFTIKLSMSYEDARQLLAEVEALTKEKPAGTTCEAPDGLHHNTTGNTSACMSF